jgi:hypothetical protein
MLEKLRKTMDLSRVTSALSRSRVLMEARTARMDAQWSRSHLHSWILTLDLAANKLLVVVGGVLLLSRYFC